MIENIDDYNEFAKTAKKYQKFEFKCLHCNKTVTKQFIRSRKFNCLCRKCSFEDTSLKKFGTKCPLQNKEVKEKIKQTVKEKYGVDCILKSKEIQEQIKKTNKEKYGAENVFASEEIKSRIKETMVERYGVEHALQHKKFLEKCNETKLERFGTLGISALPEIKEKLKRAHLKKYGVIHSSKSDVVKAKIAKTNLERYGYTAAAKNEKVREKLSKAMKANFSNTEISNRINRKREETTLKKYSVKYIGSLNTTKAKIRKTKIIKYGTSGAPIYKYIYKNIMFDSSWELAFYCYNISLNKPIKRCTKFFEYEFEDTSHLYFPDFEMNDKIFEVKGSHFFNEDGLMICPFDRSKDKIYQAKQQCGIKNNVIFITRKEITPALDYMESKYGKRWKEIFKIKKR